MRKRVREKGIEAIGAFIRENLAGRVSPEVVRAYVEMAENQMAAEGGLPCLEISMCFSLSGMPEYLELASDEVGYDDGETDRASEVADWFGQAFLARLTALPGTACEGVFDGYRFAVTAVAPSPQAPMRFAWHCLGPVAEAAPEEEKAVPQAEGVPS